MSRRRVAITGLSTITSVGIGAEENWKALIEAKSGAATITRFDAKDFRTQFACEVKGFNPDEHLEAKDERATDIFIQYALAATHQAMKQSGIVSKIERIPENLADRAGSIIGCGLGGLPDIENTHQALVDRGPRRVSPFFIPKVISNLAAGHAAIKYGLKGPNFATTSACSSGAHAMGEAFRMIRDGYMDMAVTGGAEATISPLCIAGFGSMKALSSRNEEPAKASRPFDKDRDGFVCGEGAGILVLEEWEMAKKRGANILAEMVGYGANCDAYHMTAPTEDGSGAAKVMKLALEDAKVSADAIGVINAHGTSTPLGDVAETKAMKLAFGEHAKKLKITSTKSMVGHTLGAAGGIEAAFTVMGLQNQVALPTINIDNQDPECDLDYVPNAAQDFKHEYALSNSFGFGGTNACVILRRAE
jgi:3-oxoacyl-[acyl-carrier-protein] synthase II